MEMALYTPNLGYYERSLDQIGRRGDFFTSVSVGPFFGKLLAFRFISWLGQLDARQIVETGAHQGQLAIDILSAVKRLAPSLYEKLEYLIVEPSEARRASQKRQLHDFPQVRWVPSLSSLRAAAGIGGVSGVMFSNELLDAFPVHSFIWNKPMRRWQELGVAMQNRAFSMVRMDEPSIALPALPELLLDVLPDGYVLERCPAASKWWGEAAELLRTGALMTIDYGGTLEELLNPGRTQGTLRAYSRHHASHSLLTMPGEQDLTAHVNFSEIRAAGEAAGLRTDAFLTQSQFLTAIARELWAHTGSWPPDQVRQFQTLTHPEHLGRPFRVLVQSRADGLAN